MRARAKKQRPLLVRLTGSALTIVLPVIFAMRWPGSVTRPDTFLALFAGTAVSVELGLWIRNLGARPWSAIAEDLAIALLAALLTWGSIEVAALRGGGPVSARLVAVLTAYALACWPVTTPGWREE